MKLKTLISLLAVLVLSIAINPSSLFAQGTDLGTIRGTVTDATGALLPNAHVEITDLANLTTHRTPPPIDVVSTRSPRCPAAATRPRSQPPGFGRPS